MDGLSKLTVMEDKRRIRKEEGSGWRERRAEGGDLEELAFLYVRAKLNARVTSKPML